MADIVLQNISQSVLSLFQDVAGSMATEKQAMSNWHEMLHGAMRHYGAPPGFSSADLICKAIANHLFPNRYVQALRIDLSRSSFIREQAIYQKLIEDGRVIEDARSSTPQAISARLLSLLAMAIIEYGSGAVVEGAKGMKTYIDSLDCYPKWIVE